MCRVTISGFLLILANLHLAAAQPILSDGRAKLNGDLNHPKQLSGLALHRGLLVACPDEGATLNVLKQTSEDRFDAVSGIELLDDDETEIDMEGVTSDGQSVFVVGSHSRARKKVTDDRTYKKNRERLTEIKDEKSRYRVYRIRLADDGESVSKDSISLRKILRNDEILGRFAKLPSKENGIDIEGIAVVDDKLFLGFRGPVLRGNYVPVLALRYDAPEEYDLLFVDLGGRGIRDLAAVPGGLLVLAGPVGDGEGSYELYFWNMKDRIPGEGSPDGRIVHLGTIRRSDKSKPEGIAVVKEAAGEVILLMVRDGMTDHNVERLRVALPR